MFSVEDIECILKELNSAIRDKDSQIFALRTIVKNQKEEINHLKAENERREKAVK